MLLENVRLVIQVPFYSSTTPAMIARSAGAKLVILPISLGEKYGTDTFFKLFERLVLPCYWEFASKSKFADELKASCVRYTVIFFNSN